ncbi:MAG: GreA/GreB family elongation factor [Pseudomonadales bacterium]|nr:GreA/GreB family elongation factor [Pseudomonadales bacterium]NRA18098.1 GreA/GreB family elongation factor [Oceanospirillaceae bacterium]
MVLTDLNAQLDTSEQAASSAHSQATHRECVAESRYDTLGLEQAYLAHGQSVRALELNADIQRIKQLQVQLKPELAIKSELRIKLGAVVQLESSVKPDKFYDFFFILPISGGALINYHGQAVRLISAKSPLGSGLLEKQIDDQVVIVNSGKNIEYDIIDIY